MAGSGNDPVSDLAGEIAGQPIAVGIAIRSAYEIHGVIDLGPRRDGRGFESEQLTYLSGVGDDETADEIARTLADGFRRSASKHGTA